MQELLHEYAELFNNWVHLPNNDEDANRRATEALHDLERQITAFVMFENGYTFDIDKKGFTKL